MDAQLQNAINFNASDRGFSLFDDDAESELYRNFKFWVDPPKDYAPAKDDPILMQGILYKKRNNLSFLWTEALYTLYASSTLLCYKQGKLKRMTKLRFVCVEEFPNAEDAKNEEPPADGDKRYGFKFIHDGDSFELYTENQDEYQKWRQVLKPICVFTNFHECYNMIRVLGKGNFARVYLAEHRKDGKQYAVKAFEKAKVFYSNKGKEALLNEIGILQEMDHPNIIKVYEVFESRNSIYMVTEYLKGGDLPSVVGNERDAQIILRKMFEVLHYMHSHKKVMHRDLKPENILRKSAEEPLDMKLADFGLATKVDVPEFIFTKCGTPGYVAPEVFINKKYNQAVDIFSVGVMMYKMLTGVAAFPGKDHKVILERNRECRVEFDLMVFKYVSPAALDLLKKLLDKDPFHRLTAMEALEHDFFNDTGNFMNVSPNTTPKINIQMLQAQSEESRFNMDKLKKSTLADKTPTNDTGTVKEEDTKVERLMSGSSFVTREIIFYGNNENVTDSHENSFAESRGTLQKAGGIQLPGPSMFRKESQHFIKDPLSPKARASPDEEAKMGFPKNPPSGAKKMDVYKQAIMNMHRISHSDRLIEGKAKGGHTKDKASVDLRSPIFQNSDNCDMDEYEVMTPKAGGGKH